MRWQKKLDDKTIRWQKTWKVKNSRKFYASVFPEVSVKEKDKTPRGLPNTSFLFHFLTKKYLQWMLSLKGV